MIYKLLTRSLLGLCMISLILVSCNDDDSNGNSNPNQNENLENKQPLGTSANDLLSANNFRSLRIEIAYPEGFRPTQNTIDILDDFLEERLNKPDGITIVETVINPTQQGPYTINDIVAIEDEHRTVFNNGDEIGVWMFFSGEESS